MKIGIDITQSIYEGTGVGHYVKQLVKAIVKNDTSNEYILFITHPTYNIEPLVREFKTRDNVTIKRYRLPISVLELLWNRLHIVPIEWFVGEVDVFYTSDWVEPPAKHAVKITTIHDLSVIKVPHTFDASIVRVHRRKLKWVKRESQAILCDSVATKKDVHALLGISNKRLHVVYPGID